MKGKRKAILVACSAAVVVLLVLGIGGLWWINRPFGKIRDLDARYQRVRGGMSAQEVEAILGGSGRPWVQDRYTAWWDDRRLGAAEDARIVRSQRYTVNTFFLPVTFEFTFDQDGKMVGRHRYD